MLTGAAVCLRASSMKLRISINNSRGLGSSDPDLFASSLPFYYLHPILVTAVILDQMLAMVRRRAFRLLRERVPRQLCNRLLHNCRGDGLLPHGFSPVLRLAK